MAIDEEEKRYVSRFGQQCTKCGLVRYWSCFAPSSAHPTGFDDTCCECKGAEGQKTWYAQKEGKRGSA